MGEFLKTVARKITLEVIYEVVDERTKELEHRFDRLEDDFRALRSEVHSEIGTLRAEMNQQNQELRQMVGQIHLRLDQLFAAMLAQRVSERPASD